MDRRSGLRLGLPLGNGKPNALHRTLLPCLNEFSVQRHMMKRCAFCGGEYPEEVTLCPLDRQPLDYDTLLPPVTPPPESPPMRTAFDVSLIAPQIRQVRRDYIAALRARPHQVSHRAILVAMARRTIAHLSFFRHQRPGNEIENHRA